MYIVKWNYCIHCKMKLLLTLWNETTVYIVKWNYCIHCKIKLLLTLWNETTVYIVNWNYYVHCEKKLLRKSFNVAKKQNNNSYILGTCWGLEEGGDSGLPLIMLSGNATWCSVYSLWLEGRSGKIKLHKVILAGVSSRADVRWTKDSIFL